MKEFPRLVQMHKKYGSEGFVAVSISLDSAKDKEALADVSKFLRKKDAAGLVNLIAEDKPDDWYPKLQAGGLPLVYIFDRENRRVKKLEGVEQIDYKAIEAEVAKLLKK